MYSSLRMLADAGILMGHALHNRDLGMIKTIVRVFLALLTGLMLAAPVTAYDWTGFYGGIYGAAGQVTSSSLAEYDGKYFGQDFAVDSSGYGLMAGAEIGYDIDTGGLVFGIGADVGVGSLRGNGLTTYDNWWEPLDHSETVDISSLATLTARLGYEVSDGVLIYGKAGLALGHVDVNGSMDIGDFHLADYASQSSQLGYVIGIGVEAMVAENVSVAVEYNHYDLGSAASPLKYFGWDTGMTANTAVTADAIKAGVRFHF